VICSECVAINNYKLFNVVYFKDTYQKKGYDECLYICDDCFIENIKSPNYILECDDNNNLGLKLQYENLVLEKIASFKSYYIAKLNKDILKHQRKIESINQQISKINILIESMSEN